MDSLIDFTMEYDTGATASYIDIRASHKIAHNKGNGDNQEQDSGDELEFKDRGATIAFDRTKSEWQVVDADELGDE